LSKTTGEWSNLLAEMLSSGNDDWYTCVEAVIAEAVKEARQEERELHEAVIRDLHEDRRHDSVQYQRGMKKGVREAREREYGRLVSCRESFFRALGMVVLMTPSSLGLCQDLRESLNKDIAGLNEWIAELLVERRSG